MNKAAEKKTKTPEHSTDNSNYIIGLCFAVAGAAFFSIRPILVKFAYQENIDSVTLLALRMLFSAPFYIALLVYFLQDNSSKSLERKKHIDTKLLAMTTVIGLMGYYAASLLDLYGLLYISAQLERLLLFTYPTLVVIFGAIFFAKPIKGNIVIALIFSYGGIATIFIHDFEQFGSDIIKGGIFVGLSTIVFAFYVLFGKEIINKIGSRMFTCIAMIAASTGIFIHFLITNNLSDLHTSNKVYFISFAIAIFCTIIPSFFISEAIARIGPDKTSITGTIGPVFTTLFAVTLLNEVFTVYHAIGMFLVIIGVSVLGYKKTLKKTRC
jgi:drug/metabolite transporter (DMT)-like permease